MSNVLVKRNPKGHWTKYQCQVEALKYDNRGKFSVGSKSAYSKSWKNGWLDDICSHMVSCGNKYNRCVYIYEFKNKVIYVGLTYNLHIRDLQHKKKGIVFSYSNDYSEIPLLSKLTYYIDVEEAKKIEMEYIESYKNDGYLLLNSSNGGELGGGIKKWTKERCQLEALKYNTIKEYKKMCLSYRAVTRNGWLDEICSHMSRRDIKPKGYWTKEQCHIESKKYNNMKEFYDNCMVGYSTSLKNGWLDEICSHMSRRDIKPKGYWTKEQCHIESKKYNIISDFRKNSVSYIISQRNGWLSEICSHMIRLKKPKGYWNKENVVKDGMKYESKKEFRKNSRTSYEICIKNKWINFNEFY